MKFQERLRRCFKPRFAILYPLAAYLVFFAVPDDRSLRLGIWFVLTGLFLRAWANGYAIKSQKLTTSGPYAYLRHPLYLGSLIVVLGFVVMLKIYLLGALFLLAFVVVYVNTMQKEEGILIMKFDEDYLDYRECVPALWPRWNAYKGREQWSFSFKRLLNSQEYKLFLWMIILVLGFHLKSEFLVEHETAELKNWLLAGLMLALILSDFVFDHFRKMLQAQPISSVLPRL